MNFKDLSDGEQINFIASSTFRKQLVKEWKKQRVVCEVCKKNLARSSLKRHKKTHLELVDLKK